MQRAILPALALILGAPVHAQTTLFSEDFEGASPAFTLNTTDAGSGISAWNTWVINNSYTGGTGDVICLGFPFTYTIVNTPAQPAGIATPNGKYLHTASIEGIADGITCCSFGAADGLCIPADNTFSRMSTDISTLGYTSVDLGFWWVCEGGSSYYGQVYYSTDGGGSWTATAAPAQYNFQGSWTQQTISLPAFANQATLRFGFRFVNTVGLGATDPGFAIDDVQIIGTAGGGNSIDCTVSPSPVCAGSNVIVTCTATGTFNAGNVFTAQLSDALGSFAVPTLIGSIAATASTSFAAMIPPGTPAGTGYLVRVVGSNPAVTGNPSAAFEVVAPPDAGIDGAFGVCSSAAPFNMYLGIGGTPDPGGTWTDPLGNVHGNIFDPASDVPGCYTYTVQGSAPCANAVSVHCFTVSAIPDPGTSASIVVCEGDAPFFLIDGLGGTPDPGGAWTLSGAPASPVFTPGVSPPGCYQYEVPAVAPCVNGVATLCIVVIPGPDAGQDTAITVCKATGFYNLFNLLPGTPDVGGSWTDPSGDPFSGAFNSVGDPGGDYTYTVAGTGSCGPDSAVITVNVLDQANAGSGGAATLCSDVGAVPLLGLLAGSPDNTGTWFNPGGLITDPDFNGGIDAPGVYTYVVYGATPCPNDTATLAIAVQVAPNAGTNGSYTLCETDPPTDLFTLITGTPDPGGTWTDPGGNSITGVVDPATAPSGLYTYTVSGAPACADDEALLAIVFDPCSGIEEQAIGSWVWLGQQADGTHAIVRPVHAPTDPSVCDAVGRTVPSVVRADGQRLNVDLRDAVTGVYYVNAEQDGRRITLRIVHAAH